MAQYRAKLWVLLQLSWSFRFYY